MKKMLMIMLILLAPIFACAEIVNHTDYKLEDEIARLSILLDIPDTVDVNIFPLDPWSSMYYYGVTQEIDDKNYVIYLNMETFAEQDPVEVLAHEMIHVSDLVHDILIHLGDRGYIYEGVEYVYGTDQSDYDQPMETKTRQRAAVLYQKLKREGISNALKDKVDEKNLILIF